MKIQLVDKNQEMCDQWSRTFNGCENILVYCGGFFDLKTDCVVSPANSFGFMDGGLDLAISKQLGWNVQHKLQEIIKSKHNGELLVGMAQIIETDNLNIPYCISAPTMRVPMILKDSVNVYLATKAIFNLLNQINNGHSDYYGTNDELIKSVTISGLGTGVGKVPYDICAKQMKQAYDDIYLNKNRFPNTWFEAQVKHQSLYSNNIKDLQH